MSGHSRWSQIRHKKGLTDQKRGQIFSKLSRLIALAAKRGPDSKNNSALQQAIEKAKVANMPKENIEKAIKRAIGKEGAQLEEMAIEALGPAGVALRIKAITDNRNRTLSEIRKILSDHGSKMVPPRSLDWMFNRPVSISEGDQEKLDKLLSDLDDQNEVEDVDSNLKEDNQ